MILPTEYQQDKAYWELFPYEAEIDLVEWTYDGLPMTEAQIAYLKMVHADELGMIDSDDNLYPKILKRTVESLHRYDITVGWEYGVLLRRMAMIMSSIEPLEHPLVVTARPGLGKTQMLISTLVEKIRNSSYYSAVIVTRRVQDAVKIASSVNEKLGQDVCKVRPTFALMTLDGEKCKKGHHAKDYHPTICRKKNCDKNTCSVKGSGGFHLRHKVVFVTSSHLNAIMDDGEIEDLMEYGPVIDPDTGERYYELRHELIIDENPGMVFNPMIDNRMLNDCSRHIKKSGFAKPLIEEYEHVMMYISYKIPGEFDYEYVERELIVRPLSKEFKDAWYANPHQDYYDLPRILNTFVNDGGIRRNGNNYGDYAIGLSKYREMQGLPFRTVILDGSGLKDLTYRPSDFIILNVNEIRDTSRATIHRYPVNLSKAFFSSSTGKRLDAVATEAVRVLGEKSALLITYKKHESDLKLLLEKHPNIRVAHFGNLIGSNEYLDCTAVFFAGTNDWGPMEYFTQASASFGTKIDLTTAPNKAKSYKDPKMLKFYFTLLAVGIYQDLMRSNLRVASGTDPVDIYLWTRDNEIIKRLESWLPAMNIINEQLPETLQNTRQVDQVSDDAKQLLNDLIQSIKSQDLPKTPKPRGRLLAECLGRVPNRFEVEYVFGPFDHSHYPRYVKYATEYLEK